MKRSLSRAETIEMIKIIQNKESSEYEKDKATRALEVDYRGLIMKHVNHYYNIRKDVTDKGDLIGAAWKGFYEAILKYDVSRADETQFVTYANGGIQLAVLGAYRNQVTIRSVEASTFTDMVTKKTESDRDAEEDIIMKATTSISGDEDSCDYIEQGHTYTSDKLSTPERIRRDANLTIKESILLFTKRGIDTDTGNISRVASELGIKQPFIHLETAELKLDDFLINENPKKYTQ